MRVLTSEETGAVAGGTLGLLFCLPKIKIEFCLPKLPVCKPAPVCTPKPKCGTTAPVDQ